MRICKETIIVLLSMLLISILLAHMASLLNVECIITQTQTKENYLSINDSNDHLIWFLQISDTHISAFSDPVRITDLKNLCCRTLDVIKPPVVVVSGDLTDAKTSNLLGSSQVEKEWKAYRELLNECRVQEKTNWLDIRGNHDTFNVANLDSKQNFFANYSMQGPRHPQSYIHQITKGSDTYSFIAIDTSLELGPLMPFNFGGFLGQKQINDVNKLIAKTKSSGSNYTVWFGHFPTACILNSGNQSVRNLMQSDPKTLVYLCGHLHTLGGLTPKLYTLQKEGFLELELGDWKKKRVYRLLVIDHGMLSFLDVLHGEWPIGLVTNPKHALFINTEKENLDNIKDSTHIRVLAFSLDEITTVMVRIDSGKWMDTDHVSGPLYVLEWNPKEYISGLHTIDLHIKDAQGRDKHYSQPFAMDGTRLSFGFLSRIILMIETKIIFIMFFVITAVLCILPLIIIRFLHKRVEDKKLSLSMMRGNCCRRLLRKFLLLSTVDRIFWPFVLYPVYLSFGPWSVGYLAEDHIGAIFAWGIIVNGSYIPEFFTYLYGFVQLLIFQVPLTFILAHGVDYSFQYKMLNIEKKKTRCGRVCLHLPFFLVFSLQVVLACIFWYSHGTLAFVLGPLRTWSLFLAAFLWYNVVYLPEKCTRRAARLLQITPSTED